MPYEAALPQIKKVTVTIEDHEDRITVLTFRITDPKLSSFTVTGTDGTYTFGAAITGTMDRQTGVPLPPYDGKVQFLSGSREAAMYLGIRHWTDSQGNVHWLDEEGHEQSHSPSDHGHSPSGYSNIPSRSAVRMHHYDAQDEWPDWPEINLTSGEGSPFAEPVGRHAKPEHDEHDEHDE